jgi:hypothetical protein
VGQTGVGQAITIQFQVAQVNRVPKSDKVIVLNFALVQPQTSERLNATNMRQRSLGQGIEYIVNDSRDGDSDKWAKPFAVSFCDVPTCRSFKAGKDLIFSRNSSVAGCPTLMLAI